MILFYFIFIFNSLSIHCLGCCFFSFVMKDRKQGLNQTEGVRMMTDLRGVKGQIDGLIFKKRLQPKSTISNYSLTTKKTHFYTNKVKLLLVCKVTLVTCLFIPTSSMKVHYSLKLVNEHPSYVTKPNSHLQSMTTYRSFFLLL